MADITYPHQPNSIETLFHEESRRMTGRASGKRARRLPLAVVEAISGRGHGAYNEDRYGSYVLPQAGAAWMLDGASSAVPEPIIPGSVSDPAWYAAALDAALRARVCESFYPERKPLDPVELSRAAIADMNDAWKKAVEGQTNIPLYAIPAAAGLVATWERESRELRYASLADCAMIIGQGRKDSPVTVVGPTAEQNDAETRLAQAVQREAADKGDKDAFRRAKYEALRRSFSKRNTEHGTWVFRIEDEAANHMKTGVVKLNEGDYVLMMSDGLYRLIDVFEAYTPQTLLNAAIERGMKPLYEELRRLEDDSAQGRLRYRLKASDDATGLLLRPLPPSAPRLLRPIRRFIARVFDRQAA